VNALVQDGQECRDGGVGYCYLGSCHSYTDVCQSIWGPGERVGRSGDQVRGRGGEDWGTRGVRGEVRTGDQVS